MSDPREETRSEFVGLKVTPEEKRALELLAKVRKVSMSSLLRPSIEDVLSEARELSHRLDAFKASQVA